MAHRDSGPILILFARPVRRGEVKTRLSAEIGEERALALYRAFVRDTIALQRRLSPHGIRAGIAWADEPEADRLIDEALAGFEVTLQEGEDLGQRMLNTMAELFARGHDRVVIIGADTPSLPIEIPTRAFELLRDREIVIGPSTDGGYYLIGARVAIPEIFRDIPWGTNRVLEETLKILKILGLPRVLLPVWSDVDTPRDLEQLQSSLDRIPPNDPTARHTRALLAEASP